MFKKFKAPVEKESGYKIKFIWTDYGGKFTSNEFKQYCKTHVIHHPMIVDCHNKMVWWSKKIKKFLT